MTKKSEFQVVVEGFSLIVFSVFVLLFHLLSIVPESETVIFEKISVFDVLQMGLKTVVLVLFWMYYKKIVKQVSFFYSQNLEVYPETKSDFNFFLSLIHFFTVIFIYELFVPGLKYVFSKSGENLFFIIVVLDILFVFLGILLLVKVWKAYQVFIADISTEKKKIESTELENINNNIDGDEKVI
ncbi:MAG TPA: hypothetical protein VK791_09000 [bacterium]|jgi:hypothetical protein|nr:hypothetical protein [bacterium]